MNHPIKKSILINSSPQVIWDHLTKPELISKWIGEPEMGVEIMTDWTIGNPITIKGFLHGSFEVKGLVMQYDPHQILQYSHLSSVSKLPDTPESYTILTFRLIPDNEQTLLKLHIENFPTESIFKHLDFYWAGTLHIIKDMIEKQ